MDEAKRELVQSWLSKAASDLGTARKLATKPDPYLDTAIYHCQQAGEKAVKAFLTYHDIRFDKTHDVEALINQATTVTPALGALATLGAALTPYATAFRYPPESEEPDQHQFEEALEAATRLHDFVLSALPADTHPPCAVTGDSEVGQKET